MTDLLPTPRCPECNDTGERDSGGTHPWGEPIYLACDCKDAEIGRRWRMDSSLQAWFPITAQKLLELQDENARLRAALAAHAAPGVEPVALWQYRWTNPGNKIDVAEDDLAWREVKPWNPHMQSLEQRVEELRGFEFQGVPAYEVRALYAAPTAAQPVAPPAWIKATDRKPKPGDLIVKRWANGSVWAGKQGSRPHDFGDAAEWMLLSAAQAETQGGE